MLGIIGSVISNIQHSISEKLLPSKCILNTKVFKIRRNSTKEAFHLRRQLRTRHRGICSMGTDVVANRGAVIAGDVIVVGRE